MSYYKYNNLRSAQPSVHVDATKWGAFERPIHHQEPSEMKTNDPNVWGPHLWRYMHYSAANYPRNPSEQQIQDMMTWLKTLTVTLPCNSCKEHYGRYIQNNNAHLREICSSRDKLFNFFVDIHNKVNQRKNKPILSYEEARMIYKCN